MSVCAFVYAWGPVSECVNVYVLVCTMYACACVWVYECVCALVCVWGPVSECMSACEHVCECVCICVYEDLRWVCAHLCVYEDLCVWMLVGWWSREDKNEKEEFIGFSGLRHLRFPSGLTTLLQDPMRIYKIWTNIQRYGSVAKTVLLTHLFHGNN